MTTTKQLAEKLLEARGKATQGTWDSSPASDEWKANKANNAEFCRLAANHITELCTAYLKLEAEVERLNNKYDFQLLVKRNAKLAKTEKQLEICKAQRIYSFLKGCKNADADRRIETWSKIETQLNQELEKVEG